MYIHRSIPRDFGSVRVDASVSSAECCASKLEVRVSRLGRVIAFATRLALLGLGVKLRHRV